MPEPTNIDEQIAAIVAAGFAKEQQDEPESDQTQEEGHGKDRGIANYRMSGDCTEKQYNPDYLRRECAIQ